MDQGTAQAVREIEETRDRIESNVRELEQRLPPAKLAKRAAGIATGGGVGGTVLLMVVRRMRARRNERKRAEQARVVLNVLPPDIAKRIGERMADGRWPQWMAGFVAAWLIFRLAELRQLRRMRYSLTR